MDDGTIKAEYIDSPRIQVSYIDATKLTEQQIEDWEKDKPLRMLPTIEGYYLDISVLSAKQLAELI